MHARAHIKLHVHAPEDRERERERVQGSSPQPSGSRLDEAHLSLVPPLVAADAPSHSSPSTPCEATAHPVTDSLLSSSRHLVASLSVILSPPLPAALLSLEAAVPPARPARTL